MKESTYDVRIYKTLVYAGERTTTHTVRWAVAGTTRREPFKTAALAEAFRSDLVSAARRGEAFSLHSGLPMSLERNQTQLSWYAFAREYVALKWSQLAPNSRRNTARALTNATFAMLAGDRGRPADEDLRKALTAYAFNMRAGDAPDPSPEVSAALRWLERNTRPVGDLEDPALVRLVLDAINRRTDGTAAAPGTVQRQRGVIVNLAEYAVERRLLAKNPVIGSSVRAPRTVMGVDKRVVVNPDQARGLLLAVAMQQPSGRSLVAFFAAMYFSALRPSEAATLRKSNLLLPATGWGELLLEFSTPEAGASWTDSGARREQRQLKHRARGETRTVPCPPELTALLHGHLEEFGTTDDGLLFRGVRGGQLAESTYCRVWRTARRVALTAEEVASPLAGRPYDLRHAAVSTWLNAGVPSTQVAEWAGHSVAVLHQIYAKTIVGQEEAARRRIDLALGGERS